MVYHLKWDHVKHLLLMLAMKKLCPLRSMLQAAGNIVHCYAECAFLLGITDDALPSEPYSWDYLRRGFFKPKAEASTMLAATPQQQLFRRRGCITPGKESVKKSLKACPSWPFIPSKLWILECQVFWHLSQTHQKKTKTMSSSDFPQKTNHGRAFLRGYWDTFNSMIINEGSKIVLTFPYEVPTQWTQSEGHFS